MDNIIYFAKIKSDADKSRSAHFVSLDVYLNSDNSEVWASVTNAGENDIDASWYSFVADLLRRLAWSTESMAADMGSEDGRPVASVTAFESSSISTRWADDLVVTAEQLEWVRGQMQCGLDEIEAELNGQNDE